MNDLNTDSKDRPLSHIRMSQACA